MKKFFVTIVTFVSLLAVLAGCGSSNLQMCAFCAKEKHCQTNRVFGEDIYICDDCLAEIRGENVPQ